MVFNMMEQEIVAAVEDPYGEMGDTEENSASKQCSVNPWQCISHKRT